MHTRQTGRTVGAGAAAFPLLGPHRVGRDRIRPRGGSRRTDGRSSIAAMPAASRLGYPRARRSATAADRGAYGSDGDRR